jgi:hypothetical protein
MQSIFSVAARRRKLLWCTANAERRAGALKMDWTEPPHDARPSNRRWVCVRSTLFKALVRIGNAACYEVEADEQRNRYQYQNQETGQTPEDERSNDQCDDGNENHVNLLSRAYAGHYKSKGRCS